MNCIECFCADGQPNRRADFVVNGQSLCQRHVHKAIRERGQAPLLYTWGGGPEGEPELEPVEVNDA